jgi:hypothetical protein
VGQLRYWDRTEFFRPEFAYEERRAAFGRVYSYLDLVSLKVIGRLRDETSLQQLRKVKVKLAEIGPDLWRGTELWAQDGRVAYVHPETGEPKEVVSGQRLLKLGDVMLAVPAPMIGRRRRHGSRFQPPRAD